MDKALYNAVAAGKYRVMEEPEVFSTTGNCFRYFKETGTLLVSLPDYTDKCSGQMRMGKSVGIQLDALIASPDAMIALYGILDDCQKKMNLNDLAALLRVLKGFNTEAKP